MKRIYNIIICAIGLLGGLSSCSDFLEIEPQNVIVLEKFWNEKADVEGVISGCYNKLQSEEVIKRMMVWGEFRSENFVAGTNITKDLNLENIFKGNLTASNGYTTWVDFYSIINTCNIVILYAPKVAEKDPGYTETDLMATIAEASALRDLCYFYLIRTFCDVPYTTEAYLDDNQTMDLPATSFDVVLDSLITDLEKVQDHAVKKYSVTNTLNAHYQTGRITRDAIHAMLCEMYLWKKDYQNCIRYADMVIESKKLQAEEENSNSMSQNTDDKYDGFPLISDGSRTGTYYGYAYRDIFGEGNSSETIFELTFIKDDESMPANAAVNGFYGSLSSMPGFAAPSTFIGQDVSEKQFSVFANKYDARYYENIMSLGSSYAVMKYVCPLPEVDATSSDLTCNYFNIYSDKQNRSNWIIYRLTDIMLLKAEALVQLISGSDDGDTESASNETLMRQAFTLVNAVNKRSVCQQTLKDTLVYANYNSKSLMEDLVMTERHRELMFEGKRWYDLVRRSRRDGNTQYLIQMSLRKYSDNTSVIQNTLAKMNAIYWPYNNDELKLNKNLHQNPAFGSGENDRYEQSK